MEQEKYTYTEKEKKFCFEYILHWNQTEAYMIAYPKTKNRNTAGVAANRMLRKHKIKDFIRSIHEDIEKTAGISIHQLINDYKGIKDNPGSKVKDRIKAIEELCKLFGYFAPERKDITTGGEQINNVMQIEFINGGD